MCTILDHTIEGLQESNPPATSKGGRQGDCPGARPALVSRSPACPTQEQGGTGKRTKDHG
jgi:hypothetical protein